MKARIVLIALLVVMTLVGVGCTTTMMDTGTDSSATYRFGRLTADGFAPPMCSRYAWHCEEDDDRAVVNSTSLLAFTASDRRAAYVVGNGTFKHAEGTLSIVCDKSTGEMQLIYKAILDGVELAAGAAKELDPVVVLEGIDLNSLLAEWAELTAAQVTPLRFQCLHHFIVDTFIDGNGIFGRTRGGVIGRF